MSEETGRRFHAGDRVEDYCRACKVSRTHTVMAVGINPPVVRVVCGYCGSQHNYRGGRSPRAAQPPAGSPPGSRRPAGASRAPGDDVGGGAAGTTGRSPGGVLTRTDGISRGGSVHPGIDGPLGGGALPPVTERERRYPVMSNDPADNAGVDLEMMFRRVMREEMGLGPAVPADKWRGGDMVLRPGKPGLQEKIWPIETFFHKVVMLRNRLRVLEQQINGAEIPDDLKVKLQAYITACYGSLTSFNVLFAEEEDRFHGSGAEP